MKKIKQSSSTSTNHNNIFFLISERIALKRVKKLAQFFQVSITIRSNNFCPVNCAEDILAIYNRLLYKRVFLKLNTLIRNPAYG